MSKVLVVIPTLDRPKLCARALDSLLRQKFAAWECVIALNGGGSHLSQYTEALGTRLEDERVQLAVFPDAGLGYALNEAVTRFKDGKAAFANLEDDDEWHEDFLRKMYRALSKGTDVVHCLQRQVPKQKQSNGGPMNKSRIRIHNWINWPMCLFRTSLFDKVGGVCQEAGPACDWDFHLRCVQAGAKYHFVSEVLVTHHWHPHGHSPNYCLSHNADGRDFVESRIKEGFYD